VGQFELPHDSITDIAEKHGLEFLAYFGSYGTEFYHEESDIDIAFVSKNLLKSDQYFELIRDLIIFHRKSEIDLVDLRRADPLLRYEVACHGRPFYEKENGLFDRYCLYYIKQSYELQNVVRERIRHIGNSIEEVLKDAQQRGYL
jgi:predicted nucleotidyltransferase